VQKTGKNFFGTFWAAFFAHYFRLIFIAKMDRIDPNRLWAAPPAATFAGDAILIFFVDF